MSKTFLIARREYLAFVRTVGFWLSLFTLPTIFAASIFIPMMMRQSEPVQTVAVLDLSGDNIRSDMESLIRARAPKGKDRGMFDSGGLKLVATPPELNGVTSLAEAEAKMPQVLASGRADTVMIATDNGGKLDFRIWSVSARKGSVQDMLQWDLHGLQYYKLARMNGIDPKLAHDMRESRAGLVSLTPQSAAEPKRDGFAEGFRDNGGKFIGIAFSYITWISIFSSSMILLGSVIEEKSSKVLEVLLSSASAESILLGKVLGVAGVMLTVAALWAATATTLSYYGFSVMPPETAKEVQAVLTGLFSPAHIALLLAYFCGGYLMFGVFFAAVGAFCETQKDAQAIIGPVTIVLMIPMMTMQVAFTSPDLPMLKYMSWFPLFTPFLMPLRLSQPLPWWEIAATLAGMGVVGLFMINMGRRAFRHGALSGAKLSWGNLLGLGKREV
ncbi:MULTISPECIES: ABC transporter permease [Asticcacaulis]|uniref:ABC transporter permease n=1 Tax=Asticcacaulis TaxID=76890 RepID=UPI001AEAD47F|nr:MULTISPECIES: ABC transporter permease [Asticcacaulis]MBP2161660.1 ABC-2 type transport system permease protein [Asticcacaulis solisilvae]MDR6802715.1 ABC-2 type transport system permease protein [Asticcacaulis sp. BE141]